MEAYRTNRIYDVPVMGNMSNFGYSQNQRMYDKVDVFVNRMNRNQSFVVFSYKQNIHGREEVQREVEFYKSAGELAAFTDNCPLRDTDRMHYHEIDASNMNKRFFSSGPYKNQIELIYIDYPFGQPFRRSIFLPKQCAKDIENFTKSCRASDPRTAPFDGYGRLAPVEETKRVERERQVVEVGPRRKTRREMLDEKRRNEFPMPEPKRPIRVRFAAALTTIVMIFAYYGYTVVKNAFADAKPIAFKIYNSDNFRNGVDAYLNKNNERASAIIDKLNNEDYSEITKDDIVFIKKYIGKLMECNFDKGKSFVKVLYNDYFSEDYLLNHDHENGVDWADFDDLMDNLEKMHDACFAVVGDQTVLKEKAAQKYADYMFETAFMGKGKDGRTFSAVSPALRMVALSEFNAVLKNFPGYDPSITANYYGTVMKREGLISQVSERIDAINFTNNGILNVIMQSRQNK